MVMSGACGGRWWWCRNYVNIWEWEYHQYQYGRDGRLGRVMRRRKMLR